MPSVSISFMNNFKGKVDGGTFKITVKNINNLPVLKAGDPVYSNKKDNYVTTIIAIDDNGKELKAGTDWNKKAEYYYGQNVTVMPGVHIGDGAIIGANSVVASDIPPYTVAAGNPCRVIRKRFDEELIAFLLDLKWWDWEIEKIEENFEALSSGNLSLIREIGK